MESTGPLAWLLDLFGISGDVDLSGTVLAGTTDSGGGVVLPLIRTVKYRVDITDPARGIDTEITLYPQEDEVLLTVWPQEPASPAASIELYTRETASGTLVGVRYATDLSRLTFTVATEAGTTLYTTTTALPEDDLSYLIAGKPGEVYLYGYIAEHRTAGELRQDRFIRFAPEARPWVDLAPWIPRGVYHWAAMLILVGFGMTFGRGEIRGALLTIPILAGTLWLIGWLDVSWLLVGTVPCSGCWSTCGWGRTISRIRGSRRRDILLIGIAIKRPYAPLYRVRPAPPPEAAAHPSSPGLGRSRS